MLHAYCSGVFPMADSATDENVFWVDPDLRGIIPLDGFHISRSLKKRIMSGKYKFTVDACFNRVVAECANREETWINQTIRNLYSSLNANGLAHSIEVWDDETMIGGLYGVSIGGAFFGESMFSTKTDGSKLALVALVARLKVGGYQLLDTQFLTEHLATLGGVEIPKAEYRTLLSQALGSNGDFYKLPLDTTYPELWQLITQTS